MSDAVDTYVLWTFKSAVALGCTIMWCIGIYWAVRGVRILRDTLKARALDRE